MFNIIGVVTGFILKVFPGVSGAISQYLTNQGNAALAKIGADKDVALAQLAAITAANQAKAAVIAIPGIRWIMSAVYLPPAVHAAVICFGRMHLFGFEGSAMELLPWEQNILLSLVIMVPGMTASTALHAWASK